MEKEVRSVALLMKKDSTFSQLMTAGAMGILWGTLIVNIWVGGFHCVDLLLIPTAFTFFFAQVYSANWRTGYGVILGGMIGLLWAVLRQFVFSLPKSTLGERVICFGVASAVCFIAIRLWPSQRAELKGEQTS